MPAYTTPPGTRFDLGIDGTVALCKGDSASVWTDVTSQLPGVMSASGANNITAPYLPGNWGRLRLLFPEPRSILGLRWSAWVDNAGFDNSARYSLNTTDGTNGDWNNITNTGCQAINASTSIAYLRSAIVAQSISSVLGLELAIRNQSGNGYNGHFADLHIYGQRAATGDHLQFWHPTLDQPLTSGAFDFGDIVRGVVQPAKQFRIKNCSAAKTAQTITLTYADLDGATFGDVGGQVSLDGNTWATSQTVPNLAAGAISSVLYTRVTSLSTRNPGPAAGRLRVNAAAWA